MIPSAVKISGRVFTVEIVDALEDEGQMGESDYEEGQIKIKKMSDVKMQRTLLHEIIHMGLAHAGLGELFLGINDTTEEAVVCALENSLFPLYEIKKPKSKKMEKK